MCANDGGSTIFGSAAATKITPSASCTRMVSHGDATHRPIADCCPSSAGSVISVLRACAVCVVVPGRMPLGTRQLSTRHSLWVRPRMPGAVVGLPVGETVLVDIHVVEQGAVQFLGEHVRVLAVAAGAVDDDRQGLLLRILPLFPQPAHLVLDLGFPDRERSCAGDVPLLVDVRPPGVEEERA